MELSRLADIIQGNIPTRIEVSSGQAIETIAMQELNYVANVSDDLPIEKYLTVQSDKIATYSLTREYDVVVGLSSGKAIVIEQCRAGKLILSNLAIIRINNIDVLDPFFLCWYINNNKAALKELKKLKQATAAVSVIPLSMLKSFDIVLLPIEKQRIIGKINELKRKRDRLMRIIETKKSDILTRQLVKTFEKESKNGNKRV
ncbi:MAG: hypothetical protein ACI4TK_09910 [Agathobacter sp.]